mmetsp:Transcript_150067/g.418128  ORF Transcript_150067/g.418128 Transcript_150067/m.418128 type:complete len:223 (-) Transcript_150067:716-1384(-)
MRLCGPVVEVPAAQLQQPRHHLGGIGQAGDARADSVGNPGEEPPHGLGVVDVALVVHGRPVQVLHADLVGIEGGCLRGQRQDVPVEHVPDDHRPQRLDPLPAPPHDAFHLVRRHPASRGREDGIGAPGQCRCQHRRGRKALALLRARRRLLVLGMLLQPLPESEDVASRHTEVPQVRIFNVQQRVHVVKAVAKQNRRVLLQACALQKQRHLMVHHGLGLQLA